MGVANHISDWSAPNFTRIRFVVLDPTVVRDNQAFCPWFVVVSVCSAIAVLFKPPTSKQSYHHSIDQKTSIRMQKSSTSSGKYYKNALLSHQIRCCIGDGCVWSASFVIWPVMDTRSIIFLVEACWYGYHLVHWSYGNVLKDCGFSSASFEA